MKVKPIKDLGRYKLEVDKNVTFSVVNVDLSLHEVRKSRFGTSQCGGKHPFSAVAKVLFWPLFLSLHDIFGGHSTNNCIQ